MKSYKWCFIFFMFMMATGFGVFAKPAQSEYSLAKHARQVKAIKIDNSLTREQASLIIELYWSFAVKPACMPTTIEDGDDCWFCVPNTGDECLPDKNKIIVNKITGAISWGNGPKYNSPMEFAENVLRFKKKKK